MFVAKKYRRKHDGLIVEAMQYKLPWEHDNAITEVAEFLLKLETDKATASVHDRVLDVVTPQTHLWNTSKGQATLLIMDPDTKHNMEVEAGQWITRSEAFEGLVIVTSEAFYEQYEPQEKVQDEWENLARFIETHLPGKGPLYSQAANDVAAALIGAGWRKGS